MVCRLRNLFLGILLVLLSIPMAVGEDAAPVYQRGRGPYQGGGRWGNPGGFSYGYGFYGFPPMVYGGSWYQRPYPYHLDYFRWRYSTPPVEVDAPPCAVGEVP